MPHQQSTLDHPLVGLQTEIDQLRETGRQFYDRGWSLGTSSNYSIVIEKEPLELLITASSKDKGRLTEHDFVRVDAAGKPTFAEQPKSSAETMLHCVLARQPHVGSVLHTHSVWATLLSDLHYMDSGFHIEDYEMLKGLDGISTHEHREWVKIYDNTQEIDELAAEVAQDMDDGQLAHGFLMRQHGFYTWGSTLEDARRHVEIFEFLFECVARKIMLRSSL